MGVTNLFFTVAAVGAAYVMIRGDVSKTSSILRRNIKQVRTWLEEDLPRANSTVRDAEIVVKRKEIPEPSSSQQQQHQAPAAEAQTQAQPQQPQQSHQQQH